MAKLPNKFVKVNKTSNYFTPDIPAPEAAYDDSENTITFTVPGVPGAAKVFLYYGETATENVADLSQGSFTTPAFTESATIQYKAEALTAGGATSGFSEIAEIEVTVGAITPIAEDFDLRTASQADKEFTVSGGTIDKISNGETDLTPTTHYTVVEGTLTIKKEYLAVQSVGITVLTVLFTDDETIDLTISITDTTGVLDPNVGDFDKKTANQADVTSEANGTITGVSNGETPLVETTDYTFADGILTIKKEYLATQTIGSCVLTATFENTDTDTLTITIVDTTE